MLFDASQQSAQSNALNPIPTPLAKTISNSSTRRSLYRTQSADTLSLFSTDDFQELRHTASNTSVRLHHETIAEDVPSTSQSRIKKFWLRNKGLALVAMAQLFGTLMNITTRLLEVEGNHGMGMHPFQILFARMSITFILCMLYMWYQKIPDFPLGAKGIRWLLIARGVGGFFGVFGIYWSLQYLPLSDATVLTFLAPSLASYACSKLINEPFTRIEQIGGFISLLGVVLIARPTYLFAFSNPTTENVVGETDAGVGGDGATGVDIHHEATPSQRLAAVGMAMVGVFGATCAYTTIRWIGQRAHPLISVNYFAAWCTIVSFVALVFVPSIPFVLPATPKEWTLLLFIGVSGFVLQFLLTAGLRYEKSSRATNMVYTQLLFALAGDKLIFGVTPGLWSWGGSALILGSAIVVAVQKEVAAGTAKQDVSSSDIAVHTSRSDEEMGLVGDRNEDESDNGERHGGDGRRNGASREEFNPQGNATTALEMHELQHLARDTPAGR